MIEIKNLRVRLGGFELKDISFAIKAGEYMVLLGPTGVGKTVLLECLIGIHSPRSGGVFLHGRDVGGLCPEERAIAYVPQDYALFPHLTVEDNIAYGLRARKTPKREIKTGVEAMMEKVRIRHLAGRYPVYLSGGEKQRVALARAIITEPAIVLLDEPLSALDENLCHEFARWLKEFQRSSGSTFLHVCHSFEEAACVADRAAIMNDGGVIAQVGTIEEILDHPADRFVATFTRCRNLFCGQARPDAHGTEIRLDNGMILRSKRKAGGRVTVCIRPEHVLPVKDAGGNPPNFFEGEIATIARRPACYELEAKGGEWVLTCYAPMIEKGKAMAAGDKIGLYIPEEAVHILAG